MAKGSFSSKAIGAAGLALAAVSFMASASLVTQRSAPDVAMALFPMNATAQVRVAEADFADGLNARARNPAEGGAQLARAEAMARQSLASMALNPRALKVLALTDPESPTTRALLKAGDAQSRRDTLTQIYLIDYAARDGDIGTAMQHYDTVLRRRSAFRDQAGRNLAMALAVPDVLDKVTEQLVDSPSWESLLYFYILQTPESYPSFLEMHRRLAGADTIPAATSAQFAGALVAAGQFDEALEVAALTTQQPLERGTSLAETAFVREPQFPGAWIMPENSSAFFQSINGGGAVLRLPSGTTGVLAYRLVALEPGDYFAAIAVEADESRLARAAPPLEARLSCAEKSSQNLRVSPGSKAISVTEDCRYQWLALYLTETQTRAGDFFIESITIKPAP